MISDTIQKIEARLRDADSVTPAQREELLQLLGTLQAEVATLSQTHEEEARSIEGFTMVSTHEATRGGKNAALMDHSLKGLAESVQGFEKSHPKLVHAVNSICTMLSNLGI
jgi:hypothetical protein